MGRIATGWALTKASFRVLKLDPEILAIPAMATATMVLLVGVEGVAAWSAGILGPLVDDTTGAYNFPMLAFMYVVYVTTAFVGIFFNAAIIEEASIRFTGRNPTVRDGLSKAWGKRGKILAWAFITATVGILLRMLRERAQGLAGRFAVALGELAWAAATFFVVPILVHKDIGPIDAVKESARIVKARWGEALVGVTATTLIFFLLGLVGLVPLFLGAASGTFTGMIVGGGVALLYWLVLSAASSAVRGILVAALYHYDETGRMPSGFEAAAPPSAPRPRSWS